MTEETMEPLSFHKEKFRIANLNTREEKHGDEPAIGEDIKLVARMGNAVLDKFDPALRHSFYVSDGSQHEIEGMDSTPTRILPQIESVKWLTKLEHVRLELHDAEFPKRSATLHNGKIKAFTFEMLDGGTVEVTFTVSFSKPEEDEIIKVRAMLFQSVPISLDILPPEPEPDNFQQALELGSDPASHSEARQEAERIFSGAVTSPDEIPTGLEVEAAPE